MRVQLADFEMEYEDHGTGQPVLLIHGFPLNRQMWLPQIEDLAKDVRLLAPDLRGFGGSQATLPPYSMDLLAKDCREFLQAVGVSEPVVVCGLSMGGYIALAFVRSFPNQVSRLILTATRTAPDTDEGKQKRDEMAAMAREKGAGAVAEGMLAKMLSPKTYERDPELVERLRGIMQSPSVDGIRGALQGMKERPDSASTLAQFNQPVLIVHGEDDQIIPVSEAQTMQATAQNARLELLPDSGHMLNMEQPAAFNRAVREFLQIS